MFADLPAFRAEASASQRLGDRCAMPQKLLFICSVSSSVIFAARSEMSSTDLSSAETHKRELSRSPREFRPNPSFGVLENFQLRTSATVVFAVKSRGGKLGDEIFVSWSSTAESCSTQPPYQVHSAEAQVCAERLLRTQQICSKFPFTTHPPQATSLHANKGRKNVCFVSVNVT